LLLLTYDKIRIHGLRLFDSHPLPFVFLNSTVAVGLIYGGIYGIKRLHRGRRQKNI